MEKKLGKIERATFGYGGYQDAQFGVQFTFSGDGWGCGDFWGAWPDEPGEYAKWTVDDQNKFLGDMCKRLAKVLEDAKVRTIDQLEGIPIEIEFDGMTRKSWRILKEVL